jgi:hypothetical protein
LFPCIVIESPNIRGENVIFGHSLRNYRWDIGISVYAANAATVDTIADNVLNTLETSKGSLDTRGMNQLNFITSPTFHNVIQNQVIHEKRITVELEGMV